MWSGESGGPAEARRGECDGEGGQVGGGEKSYEKC